MLDIRNTGHLQTVDKNQTTGIICYQILMKKSHSPHKNHGENYPIKIGLKKTDLLYNLLYFFIAVHSKVV